MHIYFIGINGAGISALAHLCLDAGYRVSGSDLKVGANTNHLTNRGANITVGDKTENIKTIHDSSPIDMVVFSSAVPESSPERTFAQNHNIACNKRGPFINWFLSENRLKLVAIAGTHGKTTTSAMILWIMQQLKQPVSHIIGTNLTFARSGGHHQESEYLVLEADEYDRLMLDFYPSITAIVSMDYDHPDIYPTEEDYVDAFEQLVIQSDDTITWQTIANRFALNVEDYSVLPEDLDFESINLRGQHNRQNAWLAATTVSKMLNQSSSPDSNWSALTEKVSTFPGSERRMEEIAPGIYSDYAHTPIELRATLQAAREQFNQDQNIVAIYQPHQNIRQNLVKDDYADVFTDADYIYWLPTFLTREDPKLEVLKPEFFISTLSNMGSAEPANMDEKLLSKIKDHQIAGDIVIFLGAGTIDSWARANLT